MRRSRPSPAAIASFAGDGSHPSVVTRPYASHLAGAPV